MTFEEIRLQRLSGQHLLQQTDTKTAVKDLCGVQAQFLTHARHGITLRCGSADPSDLIKSWTLRGTMHLFSADDLPLFLHRDRTHFLRPVDTLGTDAYITADRKAFFSDLIVDAVSQGIGDRDALKYICQTQGLTETEAKSLFDPWGGIIRALCENGIICHKVQENKFYQLCPPFEPMSQPDAEQELLYRYFRNFGPATIKDAAYFFGWPQRRIKERMSYLPLESFCLENRVFYCTASSLSRQDIPGCLFLSGFDQLMLGYEKTESLFLPHEHLRDIFTRSGIVRPALLIDGRVAGYWKHQKSNLQITAFGDLNPKLIHASAESLWPELRKITIE